MHKTKYIIIIASLVATFFPSIIFAQDNGENPIYIVQPGENLSAIAYKFNIRIDDLISINNITDSNLISAGSELIIPGLDGVSGILSVFPVEFGENVPVLLKKYDMTLDSFLKLNKLTSPTEAYVGTNLILPVEKIDGIARTANLSNINNMNSGFSESITHGINPWSIPIGNDKFERSFQLPGDVFFFVAENDIPGTSSFSPYISKIEISPLPLVQGHTAVIKVHTNEPGSITGILDNKSLQFYNDEINQFVYSLDGIHALKEPGLVDLSLSGQFENGESFTVNQMILIESGGYVKEELTVESTLIDEQLNIDEAAIVQDILSTTSENKFWVGYFRYPVDGSLEDDTIGFSSYFGNRRSYNNGEYFGFHGGLDFWVVLNSLHIYAPAPGTVVFTGPMDIRGYTTFIDHGQGVFSGYAHQQEILVEVGQQVNTGELIGLIGKTGRVTGPHLHWDIWVNGNQVEPFDWIYNQYP